MIVVTGMHRSGTSLAALVLRELGLDFGPEEKMYGADDWNAHGYLERTDIVDINSRIITGFSRTSSRAAQIASQVSYLISSLASRTPSAEVEAVRDVAKELRSPGTREQMAVKDPRFCLTLPAWEKHEAVSGVVVALRHPSAAVASLKKRNGLPTALGHRFWRWHMEAVLPHIGPNTLVLHQDQIVGDRADSSFELARSWLSERGVTTEGDPRRVVDASLVHHRARSLDAPRASLRLWDQLCAAPHFGSAA